MEDWSFKLGLAEPSVSREKEKAMEVKFYGTRGSVPIANKESMEIGGNTTCLQIKSQCLPASTMLVVDAGSGIVPFCADTLKAGAAVEKLHILFTHYHHDHTQGLPLTPFTFMKAIGITCWGPAVESNGRKGTGPKDILEGILKPPFFPVHYSKVGSHFDYRNLPYPEIKVILVHPQGGVKQMTLDQFERFEKEGKLFPIGKGKYARNECLVIRMAKAFHPDMTISYRFEEGPTGKVFVFLTDHENTSALSMDLKNHLKGADLLVMDSQYTSEKESVQYFV